MSLPTAVSFLSFLYLIMILVIPGIGIMASVFLTYSHDDDDNDADDDNTYHVDHDEYTDGDVDDYTDYDEDYTDNCTTGDFLHKNSNTARLLLINQTISFLIGEYYNCYFFLYEHKNQLKLKW